MGRSVPLLLVLILAAGALAVGGHPSARSPPTAPLAALSAHAAPAVHPSTTSADHRTVAAASSDGSRGRTPLTGPLSRFPHPTPPRVATPSYYGHYYAGTVYNGTNFSSNQLSATIQVPLDVAQTTDFYYVILSVWDNASSYDQIGFANAGGVFGVAYSTTDYCANNYYYSPDAYALTPGVTYNFTMTILKGTVSFFVKAPNGTLVWSYAASTGGAYFVDTSFFSCYYAPAYTNITAYDYTDYEEVYQTFGNVPPYDFFFGENVANDSPVTAFTLFTTPPLPGPTTVPINGDNAVVANEPYNLYLNQVNSTFSLVSPKSAKSFTAKLGLSDVAGSGPVNLTGYSVPTGWTVTPSLSSASPPATFTVLITVPVAAAIGNYSVGIAATDISGDPNQVSLWFSVVPPISVAVHVGPHPVADLGQAVTISAVPGGGLGGLAYTWTGLPPGCAGGLQVLHCSPNATGVYTITVVATDSVGDFGTSPVFSLTVNPDPVPTLIASPSRVDVNQSTQWFASAVSGSGGFTFSWNGLFAGCTALAGVATCTPKSPGIVSLSAVVTDAAGFSVTSAPAAVTVLAAPSVSLVLSRYTVDAHQPVLLTASASGGSGAFTYTWTGLPGGCSSNAPTATCAFGSPGSYLVTVGAYDSFQVSTPVARAYVTVTSDPVVLLAATTPSVDLGQSAQFDVHVSGGAPGYAYHYANLPGGCASANSSTVRCVPTTIATYANLTVHVTDRNNWTVNSSINFTVYSDPTVSLTVTPNPVAVGNPVDFVVSVQGGSGSSAYDWADLPGGCQAAPTASISCTPGGTGSTVVNVSVTDRDGFVVNTSTILTVTVAPSALAGSGTWLFVGIGVVLVVAVLAIALWARRRRASPPAE